MVVSKVPVKPIVGMVVATMPIAKIMMSSGRVRPEAGRMDLSVPLMSVTSRRKGKTKPKGIKSLARYVERKKCLEYGAAMLMSAESPKPHTAERKVRPA